MCALGTRSRQTGAHTHIHTHTWEAVEKGEVDLGEVGRPRRTRYRNSNVWTPEAHAHLILRRIQSLSSADS